ncbi:MAG TPA: hypothetical protein PL124_06370 [Candidatus Cloacimonadota bacterium]|nr:hypothetical protein [Candidatus Cloacimonadota bacterium]HPS39019.1 hypothetical protein [Candidatus Cloacimonadota bacterium]
MNPDNSNPACAPEVILPNDCLTVLVEKQYIDMIPVEILRGFVIKRIEEQQQKPLN